MRPNEYLKRNKLLPNRIKNTSRYVKGRLHPHRRPVDVPAEREPDDDPRTRGLTENE